MFETRITCYTFTKSCTIEGFYRLQNTMVNDGCLFYVQEDSQSIYSSDTTVDVLQNEAVLMKCGSYIADFMISEKQVRSVVFQFQPSSIKKVRNYPSLYDNVQYFF